MRVLVLLLLELVHFGVAYAVPVDVEAMAQQASRVAVELPDPLPARLLEPRPVPAVTARPKAKARDKGWLGLGVKRKIAAGSYSAATASVAGAAALVYNSIQTADKTHERKVHRTACRSTRKRAFSESFLLVSLVPPNSLSRQVESYSWRVAAHSTVEGRGLRQNDSGNGSAHGRSAGCQELVSRPSERRTSWL